MAVKLELYRVFRAVAEKGSISAAAQELFISQPAVSQSIRQLEEQLNLRLFSRGSRGVTLTGEGKLLLVQESNGKWALPGGWVDYNLTIRENAIKETREEAGMDVRPLRVIALHEHNKRNARPFPFNIISAYVLCEYLSGEFELNLETVACGFF